MEKEMENGSTSGFETQQERPGDDAFVNNAVAVKPGNVFRIWFNLQDGTRDGRGFLARDGVQCEYGTREEAEVEADRLNGIENRERGTNVEYYRVMEFDPSGHSVRRPGPPRKVPPPFRGRICKERFPSAADGPPADWLAHVERFPSRGDGHPGAPQGEDRWRDGDSSWVRRERPNGYGAPGRGRPDPYVEEAPRVDRGRDDRQWDDDRYNWR